MRTFTIPILVALVWFAGAAAARSAQAVVITTKPRFEQHGQIVDLIISDTNQSFDIGWGMPPNIWLFPLSLDTNRLYTFTVGQKPFDGTLIPELRKVQSGSQTIYDIEVCEIHKTKMEYKKVKIVYGLMMSRPGEPSGDTERRLFPHHREYSLGGCVIMSDSPKTEQVYVCNECKKAYEKWKLQNKNAK